MRKEWIGCLKYVTYWHSKQQLCNVIKYAKNQLLWEAVCPVRWLRDSEQGHIEDLRGKEHLWEARSQVTASVQASLLCKHLPSVMVSPKSPWYFCLQILCHSDTLWRVFGFGEIMWSFLQLFLWQSSLVCGIRILIDWCCETPLPELFLWWIVEYLDDPQILSNKSFLILSCHDDRITLWCSLNLLKMPVRWKWML